jgi:hypothetical protein
MSNEYIDNAVAVRRVNGTAYCVIENKGKRGGYLVRVLPQGADSYWLEDCGGQWETESGAHYAILSSLDESAA